MAKSKIKSVYICQSCGAQSTRWEGRCPSCGEWNTFVEELVAPETPARGLSSAKPSSAGARGWDKGISGASGSFLGGAIKLGDVAGTRADRALKLNGGSSGARLETGYNELDRVLGGGLVRGSFVLVGGDPGIGKSTLLLQMAGGLAGRDARVLYVSGEESIDQTGLRAERLGLLDGPAANLVTLSAESQLEAIREMALAEKPDVLVVDSIQTVFLSDLSSAPGSVAQVRECAASLMNLAKGHGISVFVIGHVTKEGQIAGPKVLEHMVDTVLSFEGDKTHAFRLLRALKNRFGATHELGVFSMDSRGLVEVDNPSELFLEERGEKLIGSAVFCSMEGSRPLLCEVQALTISTNMPMPRRTSIGFETNRVHLLAAVLNRHLGLKLAQSDLFINVVGGLRLDEPAADFAVAAALISSETGSELDAKTCFFGELGLTGEARAVPFAESRLREARKLGFTRFIVPASNKKQLQPMGRDALKGVVFVKNAADLAEAAVASAPGAGPSQRSSGPKITKAQAADFDL